MMHIPNLKLKPGDEVAWGEHPQTATVVEGGRVDNEQEAPAEVQAITRACPESSNIAKIHYNVVIFTLVVEFTNGSLYSFDAVDGDLASRFLQAESKGGFFARNIRDKFTTTKLVGPKGMD